MPQFSKGEWEVIKHNDDSGYTIKSVHPGELSQKYRVPNENVTHGADARLIAEAPVMYDLLNKAFHILGKNIANDEICREIDECLSRVDGVPVQKGNENNA